VEADDVKVARSRRRERSLWGIGGLERLLEQKGEMIKVTKSASEWRKDTI